MMKKPRPIPPYSTRSAEAHLHKARQYANRGMWGDALMELGRALDKAPALRHDPTAIALATDLIGSGRSERDIALLAERTYRQNLIRHLAPPPRNWRLPLSRGFVFLCLVCFAFLTAFINDGQTIFSHFFSALQPIAWQVETHIFDETIYHIVQSAPQSHAQRQAALLVLAHTHQSADEQLKAFAPRAYERGVLLAIVRATHSDTWQIALDGIFQGLGESFPAYKDQWVLFGHGESARRASQFAQSRPNRLSGVIMSGAPFVYPPPTSRPTLPYFIIYGSLDPILVGSTSTHVNFTEIDEWTSDFKYAVIPNVGAEFTPHHVDLVFTMLDAVYGPRD